MLALEPIARIGESAHSIVNGQSSEQTDCAEFAPLDCSTGHPEPICILHIVVCYAVDLATNHLLRNVFDFFAGTPA